MENKTSKYFKYAIGEIILVVIGILIALQINNWNGNRMRANEELNILKAIKIGLETDLSDLKYNANSINTSIKHADQIIKSIENDESYRDSIADHIGIAMFPVKFLYSTSAFETLKSKGIDLVTNSKLRDAIVAVYDSGYTFFLDTEKAITLDESERGFRYIFSTRFEESYVFDLDQPTYEPRLVPLDYEKLKQDQEFLYYFKSYRNRLDIFSKYHYRLKIIPQVEQLIKQLDEEINHLQN